LREHFLTRSFTNTQWYIDGSRLSNLRFYFTETFSPVIFRIRFIIKIDRECSYWSNHCFLNKEGNSNLVQQPPVAHAIWSEDKCWIRMSAESHEDLVSGFVFCLRRPHRQSSVLNNFDLTMVTFSRRGRFVYTAHSCHHGPALHVDRILEFSSRAAITYSNRGALLCDFNSDLDIRASS
jgi:hypothetical protein